MKNKGWSIQQVVNDYLKNQDEENKKNKVDKFRISDMGRCFRMRYWKRAGKEQEPFDERTLRVLETGNIFHWWLQKRLEEIGVLVEQEGTVENNDFIGHFDAIVEQNGKKLVYDFKTQNSRAFHYVRKNGNKAKEHQMMQLMTYVYFINKDKYPELDEGRLLMISKDDMCLMEFGEKLANYKGKIEEEINKMKKYWDGKILPPAEPQDPQWECGYCSYKETCEGYKKYGKNKGGKK